MNGTVAPPANSASVACTCSLRSPSSPAITCSASMLTVSPPWATVLPEMVGQVQAVLRNWRGSAMIPDVSTIAYLCTDLLFTSKIRETAHALGHKALVSRDPAGLLDAARGADLVIVDLRRPDARDALD